MIKTAHRDLVVYKKLAGNRIATLIVPKGTMYNDPGFIANDNRKCRAQKVIVRSITSLSGKHYYSEGFSIIASSISRLVQYKPGKILCVKNFDTSYITCSSGIHFFLTKKEARKFSAYGYSHQYRKDQFEGREGF